MEVVVFPRIAGVQWSDTVESTLWGTVLGVAAVVDIVLSLAEIVLVSCQSLRAAWSSLLEVRPPICDTVAFGGPRRSKSCVHQRGWDTRRSWTPWTECRRAHQEVWETCGGPGPLEGGPVLWLRVMGIHLRGACGDTGPLPKQEVGPGPYV